MFRIPVPERYIALAARGRCRSNRRVDQRERLAEIERAREKKREEI